MTNREWLNTLSDEEFVEIVTIDCDEIQNSFCCGTMAIKNYSCEECMLDWLKSTYGKSKRTELATDIESIIADKTWNIHTLAEELEKMGYKKNE